MLVQGYTGRSLSGPPTRVSHGAARAHPRASRYRECRPRTDMCDSTCHVHGTHTDFRLSACGRLKADSQYQKRSDQRPATCCATRARDSCRFAIYTILATSRPPRHDVAGRKSPSTKGPVTLTSASAFATRFCVEFYATLLRSLCRVVTLRSYISAEYHGAKEDSLLFLKFLHGHMVSRVN